MVISVGRAVKLLIARARVWLPDHAVGDGRGAPRQQKQYIVRTTRWCDAGVLFAGGCV